MMSAEGDFHELAHHVRDLLECGAACLFLGCPEAELRHPLLDMFLPGIESYVGFYGSVEVAALLKNECVRALCDSAVQSGEVCSRGDVPLSIDDRPVQSIAAAPLERPAGILGIFLLTDARAHAFGAGEQRLLESYRGMVAQSLEKDIRILSKASSVLLPGASHNGPVPSIMLPVQLTPRQQELDRLKSEFISMVSHELRTPLTAIKGYAGLLQAYSVAEETHSPKNKVAMTQALQQQYLDIIMEQTNHLEVLASDLLDISRIHADRLVLRFVQVNIEQLCQQVAELMQHRVDQEQPGRYYIRCMLEPGLPPAWADADRVQQVLTNLLENAIKYSLAGGLIEIQVYVRHSVQAQNGSSHPLKEAIQDEETEDRPEATLPHGPQIMYVIVRDQGIGISPDQQARLFQPFSRVEHPATSHIPGAGLGLYITRKLVEAMGGTITLQSDEEEGTSVTFTLPVV
ncbi:MAG: HAMP domain-containing histidine kinase [Chloroflexota bacterium]|nr:HAMP domain-containing histidine kinase [Chloroflexota bacterium]